MKIKIPFKTPSVNHLYFTMRNLKILTKEARELKIRIKEICDDHEIDVPIDKPLKVVCSIHEDWYYKNGSIKRADVANREKFIVDAVFDSIGIDDRNIFENSFIKVQDSENEFSEIEISLL